MADNEVVGSVYSEDGVNWKRQLGNTASGLKGGTKYKVHPIGPELEVTTQAAEEAPSFKTKPSVTSTSSMVGTTLGGNNGTWAGNPMPTLSRVFWLKNGTVIPDQNGNTLSTATGFVATDEIIRAVEIQAVINGQTVKVTEYSEPFVLTAAQAILATITPFPLIAGKPAQVVFNTPLASAPSATGGITFTGSGTTWDFTAPSDPEANVTISATKTNWGAYTQIIEIDPDLTAYEVVRLPDYGLGINTLMSSGEAAFEIRNSDNEAFIGTHAVDRAILEEGPHFHVPPEIDDTEIPLPGEPLVGRSGLIEITPRTTGAEYDELWTRLLNGVAQADLIGSYGPNNTDGVNVLRQRITDAKGTREALSAPVIFAAPKTMTRNSVLFNGTAALRHHVNLADQVTSFLLFAQFTRKGAATRQHLFNIDGTGKAPISTWDADAVRSSWQNVPSGAVTGGAGTALIDERVSAIWEGHITQAGAAVVSRSYLKANALEWQHQTTTVTDRPAFSLAGAVAAPGFTIGGQHYATTTVNQPWFGSLHRLAFWANPGEVDVSSAGVRNLFLKTGTDDLMQPSQAYGVFNQPLFDLYGPAADYNARKLNGTIGTADVLMGTFTNG